MPSCAPQTVRRDVVRRFAAAATSSSGRIGLPGTVDDSVETSGRRSGRVGTAAAAPGPRPTVLRPTPNTLSVFSITSRTVVRSFVIAGRGPAYSGPQLGNCQYSVGPMRLPGREEGNWLVCASVCVKCRVKRVK